MLVLGALIAIIIVVITPLVNWYLSYSKYSCLRNVPGPKPYPIIGNARDIVNTSVGKSNVLEVLFYKEKNNEIVINNFILYNHYTLTRLKK